jgi:hypothetical protein
VTLLSSHGFAKSQIKTEFELVLPKQFQQNLINQKWETFANKEFAKNWQFPNQTLVAQGEIPVQINDIFLQIKTQLKKPAVVDSQTAIELSSQNLQALLTIGDVNVDHVIEREVGGIVGRFRLQASCKNVQLQMKAGEGDFAVILTPTVNSSTAGSEIQSVRLGWKPDAWVVASMQCSGAEGFDTILRAEIQKMAQDSNAFVSPHLAFIKNSVQEELNKITFDFSKEKKVIMSRPDLQVSMTVDQLQDLGSAGAKVRGHFLVDFLKAPDEELKELNLEGEGVANGSLASLRLPKEFLKEAIKRAYAPNTWMYQITSDKISGFSSLMQSRFTQFFVWPELMSYPKNSIFRFDVYSNKALNISGQGMNYNVAGTIYTQMQSPQKIYNGKLAPFMDFTVPLQTPITVDVSNSVLTAKLGGASMKLNAQWNKDYLKNTRGVSQYFSANIIKSRIIDAIAGKTITTALPKIPISEGLSLTIKKARVNAAQDLIIDLSN